MSSTPCFTTTCQFQKHVFNMVETTHCRTQIKHINSSRLRPNCTIGNHQQIHATKMSLKIPTHASHLFFFMSDGLSILRIFSTCRCSHLQLRIVSRDTQLPSQILQDPRRRAKQTATELSAHTSRRNCPNPKSHTKFFAPSARFSDFVNPYVSASPLQAEQDFSCG